MLNVFTHDKIPFNFTQHPVQTELVVADDGSSKDYGDYGMIDVAINDADATPNVATKCGPALQKAKVLSCNLKLL